MMIGGSMLKAKFVEKKNNVRDAFKSWEAFKTWIMVPDTALDEHGHTGSKITWSNIDLDPDRKSVV